MPKISKTFTVGFICGAATALTVVIAGLTTIKVTMVDPAKHYQEWIDENKKLANRKALRR